MASAPPRIPAVSLAWSLQCQLVLGKYTRVCKRVPSKGPGRHTEERHHLLQGPGLSPPGCAHKLPRRRRTKRWLPAPTHRAREGSAPKPGLPGRSQPVTLGLAPELRFQLIPPLPSPAAGPSPPDRPCGRVPCVPDPFRMGLCEPGLRRTLFKAKQGHEGGPNPSDQCPYKRRSGHRHTRDNNVRTQGREACPRCGPPGLRTQRGEGQEDAHSRPGGGQTQTPHRAHRPARGHSVGLLLQAPARLTPHPICSHPPALCLAHKDQIFHEELTPCLWRAQ